MVCALIKVRLYIYIGEYGLVTRILFVPDAAKSIFYSYGIRKAAYKGVIMIIVLKNGITKQQAEEFKRHLEEVNNIKVCPIAGTLSTVYGLVGDTYRIDIDSLRREDIVEKVMRVQEPYKLVNRKFHPEDTVIDVSGVKIGGKKIVVMAGPCSIENYKYLDELGSSLKEYGASILRGGAFKPRTSPYSFQGLGEEGLEMLRYARDKYGIPVISEITNIDYLDDFMKDVDIIQVGARNMQNFELLKALGKVDKPILLKRGFANTIEELLMSAEYIMSGGNSNVMLCERGIRTVENYTRNTLDLSAVPVLKQLTHLPVIVDPSHATGIASLVEPMSKAAIAAGADGLIIEVHPEPKCALCDGPQSILPQDFKELMNKLRRVANAVDREI